MPPKKRASSASPPQPKRRASSASPPKPKKKSHNIVDAMRGLSMGGAAGMTGRQARVHQDKLERKDKLKKEIREEGRIQSRAFAESAVDDFRHPRLRGTPFDVHTPMNTGSLGRQVSSFAYHRRGELPRGPDLVNLVRETNALAPFPGVRRLQSNSISNLRTERAVARMPNQGGRGRRYYIEPHFKVKRYLDD